MAEVLPVSTANTGSIRRHNHTKTLRVYLQYPQYRTPKYYPEYGTPKYREYLVWYTAASRASTLCRQNLMGRPVTGHKPALCLGAGAYALWILIERNRMKKKSVYVRSTINIYSTMDLRQIWIYPDRSSFFSSKKPSVSTFSTINHRRYIRYRT